MLQLAGQFNSSILIHLQNSCGTLQGEIHHVVNPDPYRGIFGSDASSYVKDVQDHIDYGTSGRVAGFIAETIQVCFSDVCNWT